jgi:hypothetical protein
MKNKAFMFFLIIIALLSMAGDFLPAPVAAISTPTPTPTRRPSASRGEFILSRANKIPPADIINQISVIGRGGGEICKSIAYTAPTLASDDNTDTELMVFAVMEVCGWTKNEKLTGGVQYPGGQTQTVVVDKLPSNGNIAGVIRFRPSVDDPTGKYILTMTGKSGTVRMAVNYFTPKSPAIYELDDYHLLLYKFSSSEKIRLFFYDDLGDLAGWQQYTAGTDGRLEIKSSVKVGVDGLFIAVGEKTGEVRMKGQTAIEEPTIVLGKKFCSNGLPSRVKVGDQARAAYTDGSNLRIRVAPGFSQSYEHKVPEGTKMRIVGGPKCADNSTWWNVEISGNIKGWVAEYWNGSEYLIEPVR